MDETEVHFGTYFGAGFAEICCFAETDPVEKYFAEKCLAERLFVGKCSAAVDFAVYFVVMIPRLSLVSHLEGLVEWHC